MKCYYCPAKITLTGERIVIQCTAETMAKGHRVHEAWIEVTGAINKARIVWQTAERVPPKVTE